MNLKLPEEAIIHRYENGETMADLAASYECCLSTIRDIIPRNLRRNKGRPKLNIPVSKLVAEYKHGKTLEDLAGIYGCSVATIHKLIPKESRRGRGAPSGPRDAKRVRKIANMREEGMTFQEIADHLGVSRQCVHQTLTKHQSAIQTK